MNTSHSKWFEREFLYELPLELLPNIVERLRSGPAAYQDRVGNIPPHILTKREGDSWSIQENVGHILDLEPLWLGRVEDFVNGEEILRPTDLSNTKTSEAGHNDSRINEILDQFREARFQLVVQIENLDEEVLSRNALHPRLKTPMNIVGLAYFVAEHDIHHLVRIRGLAQAFKVN